MAENDFLCFNGINGATGQYLLPPLTTAQIAAMVRGETIDPRVKQDLAAWYERSTQKMYAVVPGIDVGNLAQTGWGAIFAYDADPAVREALAPLLDLRREQAGQDKADFYQEFVGPRGYRPHESNREFLARHGIDPSQPADPARGVPYYLLLVGSPEQIPFRFQYQLDVQYAVGRLWFEHVHEYRQYAQSVVAAEGRKIRVPRTAVFFGTRNEDDPATALSASELVTPLADALAVKVNQAGQSPWTVNRVVADEATKERLSGLLGGRETPALLFTASHGMGFPKGDPDQLPNQGALLCQDWPGPRAWTRAIPRDHYFSADDLPRDAQLQGLIACHFACYGAGTPRLDDFAHQAFRNPVEIAPQAFVASLPRRLLSHPSGGALAVIGHVERAWGYSFYWNRIGRQLQTFEATLYQLMQGLPVGTAVDYFNLRYAALSTELTAELEEIKFGREPDNALLAGTWTAHNDARSYVVLGDPAVRLPLVAAGEAESRGVSMPSIIPVPVGGVGNPAYDTPEPAPTTDGEPSLLDQIRDTEERYARRSGPASFDIPTGAGRLQRQNDPRRLRWRLEGIGVPQTLIDDVLRYGVSYQIVAGNGEAEADDRWLERILGRNDMVDAPRFLERGVRAARAVGRVRIRSSSGRLSGWGTGSLIAERLMLTNNHVLRSRSAAASSLFEFRVEDGDDGVPRTPVVFRLVPDDFFVTSRNLDFTLVAVAATSNSGEPLDDFGWNSGTVGDDPVLIGETVNIIQHPRGRPKQVALRDNTVIDLLPEFLHYRADTEPGSSGSPVFNDQWNLVGLHHSGVPKRDERGNILARDGSIWREDMGDHQIDWIANEGVRLSRILESVRAETLTNDTARQLRDGLLTTLREERGILMADPVTQPRRPPVDVAGNGAPGNTTTLTIPLHITVSLGSQAPTAVGVSTGPAPSPPTATTGGPEEEAVTIDPDYENREGYDPEFLGTGRRQVPLPKLSSAQTLEAARLLEPPPGGDRYELKYHHYSVVMNARRRQAFFTAVNIDGRKARDIARERDKWFYDPRIRREEQVGNELYASNPFDRGHLVRRLDPAWGRTLKIAKVANDDTFHWTNCSPQHEDFNQGQNLWQGVENFLLDRATDADQRLTVFTGPVFRDDDPEYRGIRIPLEFWKVAVLVGEDGKLVSLGFVVTQKDLIRPVVEEAAIDTARTFQASVAEVERLTGLDFGKLRTCDIRSVDSFAPGELPPRIQLLSFSNVQLPAVVRSVSAPAPSPSAASSFGPTDTSGERSGEEAAMSASSHPQEPVAGTDLSYYLLAYDEEGRERTDHPAGLISEHIVAALESEPVTDVFLFSHGWRGDVPAAREQYQGWLRTMAGCASDRQRIRQIRPGFRPLLIGLHWPSEPWGDESLSGVAFAPGAAPPSLERRVVEYATRLGDGPQVRDALQVILQASENSGEPDRLPDDVLAAYRALDAAVALPKAGVGGPPGMDWDAFDPEAIYQAARRDASSSAVSYGGLSGVRDTILAPLRTLSFWKMKDRGRKIGEVAVHPLLRRLQHITTGRDVRFHLAGHSFGGILTSAAIAGPPTGALLPRPVDSLVLVQGAFSLWGFCSSIPHLPGSPGYFHRIVAQGLVRGPVVTTHTRHDTALSTWYPRAAWAAGQVVFAPGQLPKYGAAGSFGLQGPGIRIVDVRMLPATADYGLRGGHVYNVNGDLYINQGGGLAGAHSDIRKPEVGHLAWAAYVARS